MSSLFRKLIKEKCENIEKAKRVEKLFKSMGTAAYSVWEELKRAENYAVDFYNRYLEYFRNVDDIVGEIDFGQVMLRLNNGEVEFPMTVGDCIMLNLSDIEGDIYVATEETASKPVFMTYDEYINILGYLNETEVRYCEFLKDFFKSFLLTMLQEADEEMYGYRKEYRFPINTLEAVNYHKYIFDGESQSIALDKKWNRIEYSPAIFQSRNKVDANNPIIICGMSLDSLLIDVPILDCLCYGAMKCPISDFSKFWRYRDEKRNLTLKQIVAEKYGTENAQFIESFVESLNLGYFRELVRKGIKI